ncbi:MAG: excinuclease ABC subunit UvrC, partial [Clostridia bacterium]|nr:excinuclease ABC subunit UvrC [Clostridia bacterium]
TVPERIEVYDISNLGSEHITAGMIVAENARFKKSDYRYFKIRSVSGAPDDYASMREVILRRVAHLEDSTGS